MPLYRFNSSPRDGAYRECLKMEEILIFISGICASFFTVAACWLYLMSYAQISFWGESNDFSFLAIKVLIASFTVGALSAIASGYVS